MIKTILLWILTAALLIHSIALSIRSNFNFGTFLVWVIAIMVLIYAIFHVKIDEFTAQGIGRILKYIFLTGVVFMTGMFAFVAISGYTHNAQKDEKAIIVLGAGLHGERVSDVLRRRLDACYDAWTENQEAIVVVTGGQGPQEVIPEAVAMERYLVERGIPKENIIMEDKSTSTEENLIFAKELLALQGISTSEPVSVVTNAFHCYRAGQYSSLAGFEDVRNVPATMNIFSVPSSYLREIFAVLYYWVFKR